jgi:hypothetical protein
MSEPRDEFLSEEDLDLRNLPYEEFLAYWNLWLARAQISNELIRHVAEPPVTHPRATAQR